MTGYIPAHHLGQVRTGLKVIPLSHSSLRLPLQTLGRVHLFASSGSAALFDIAHAHLLASSGPRGRPLRRRAGPPPRLLWSHRPLRHRASSSRSPMPALGDEPMDHQVISKKSDENCSNVTDKFTIQFGSFLCELKESNMKKGNVVSDTSMASRLIFEGTNLFKYKRKMK